MEELAKSGVLSDEFGTKVLDSASTVIDQVLAGQEA
jgi:hypothetical protein